jgi:RNA polymerase sigma-70 factor (ECF subfamily)
VGGENDLSDDLIRRCRQGDANACADLYRQSAGSIMAYFLRSGFARPDAEDLTQETFLRAFRGLAGFEAARGRFWPWLAAIARNVARDAFAHRRPAAEFDPELAELSLAQPAEQDRQAQLREDMAGLEDCLAKLPPELAHLVRLRYVTGLTTRGVAEQARLAEATVRLHLEQARSQLERCMKLKGLLP